MTILFLDQFSEPGGAQQCLADLLPAVTARGWQAIVAAPGEGWLAERARCAGAEFHSIRYGPFASGRKAVTDGLRLLRQAPQLRREIAAIPADLLYVNGPRLLPAIPAGRPLIFHCHSHLATRPARWLATRSVRRTRAAVVGACRFVVQPFEGAKVVYNGIAAKPAGPCRGGAFRIGMIGRIAPQKGQLELLRAARHLPGIEVTICGASLFGDPGYAENLRAEAAGMPVEFLDWQPAAGPVLSRLNLLVVPSTVAEATPRVILEAFAAGVPVLASNCGGIAEMIEHNQTGFLIHSLQPTALAAQIRELAAQPNLRTTVAARAQAAWREHYTIAEYQRRILSIIESVGANARK